MRCSKSNEDDDIYKYKKKCQHCRNLTENHLGKKEIHSKNILVKYSTLTGFCLLTKKKKKKYLKHDKKTTF